MIKTLSDIIQKQVGGSNFEVKISGSLERGHLSTNAAFTLAEKEKRSPMEAAEDIRSYLHKHAPDNFFERIEIVRPGFVNVWLTAETIRREFKRISKAGTAWGKGKKKKEQIIVEYSSPNIAKPMHVGHLRSIVIGDAIANVFEFAGYKVVRWNYLGDWGTQFGKVITAYKLWGDKKKVKRAPLEELGRLYLKFHEELKDHPELEDRGREEFKKLEEGDKRNTRLWRWFRKESLKGLGKIYNKLGVRFSDFIGEAFYSDKLRATIDSLIEQKIARESQGALIVNLDKFGLPPGMVRKSDGATLYLTRDIANLQYRLDEYNPRKILYVIGNEQALHLAQVFAIAKLMKTAKDVELTHVKYGLILGEDSKRFSTRAGGVVQLEWVLKEAIKRAGKIIEDRDAGLSAREAKEVAEAVGIGAIKYNDLSQNRMSDIVFSWDKMLSFEGNSAPYLQYTYARLRSILRKAKRTPQADLNALAEESDMAMVLKLAEFPDVIDRILGSYSPHHLANYLYDLARAINSYYHSEPVLYSTPELRSVRLNLVKSAAGVLQTGLGILGIKTVEKM